MQPRYSRKKIAIAVAFILGLIALVIIIGLAVTQRDTNQFGKFIRIQNYGSVVENLSPAMRDAMESYLYTVVVMNVDSSIDASKINDAYIRENTDGQSYNPIETLYEGTFIIDIESIKQSYKADYQYLVDTNDSGSTVLGGNPVSITCLQENLLIYGTFNCKDLISEQRGEFDEIMQHLPYQNFSMKITPDTVKNEGKLTLHVEMTIPVRDLTGPESSRREVVAMYKKQVTDWITEKGGTPSEYIIEYNYDDVGNLINQPSDGD